MTNGNIIGKYYRVAFRGLNYANRARVIIMQFQAVAICTAAVTYNVETI